MGIYPWLLLLTSTVCFVYGDDKHFICKQVGEIFSGGNPPSSRQTSIPLQGRTGKRGSIGGKGDRGDVGPPGPPAVVNYTKIQHAVLEDVEDLRNDVNTWKQLAGKISHLVNIQCGVFYNEKCFRAILHDQQDVDFNAARSICQGIGWELANIYDANHYTMIKNYLREKIPSSRDYNTAWLGMTINPQNKEMRYSFGERASDDGIKWHPGYPVSSSSYTNIAIQFYRGTGNLNQGIHSYPPTGGNRNGAICEI